MSEDIFSEPIRVYYYPKLDNLILVNPATIFMLATMQGSNNRKMCINEEHEVKKENLVYLGEL